MGNEIYNESKYSYPESGYKSDRKFVSCKKLNKFQIPSKRMPKEKKSRYETNCYQRWMIINVL